MIPLIFCGKDYRDWPWWMFWKRGHREHEYDGVQIGLAGPFTTKAFCPGRAEFGGWGK